MKFDSKYFAAGVLGLGVATLAGLGTTYAAIGDNGDRESFGKRGGHQGGKHLQIASELLGISADDLKERVQGGEKVRDILDSAGVTKDEMRAAHQTQMQERLAQAVADGRLTQAEADEKLAQMAERHSKREAVHTAVENNDYAAWSAAVAGTPMADKVTAENFAKFVEAHNLREAGDHEGARAIMEELGIEKGGHGKGFGKRGGHFGKGPRN